MPQPIFTNLVWRNLKLQLHNLSSYDYAAKGINKLQTQNLRGYHE